MRTPTGMRAIALTVLSSLVAIGCTSAGGSAAPTVEGSVADPSSPSGDLMTPAESACAMPHEQLLRVWRGTRIGASGNVQIVPAEPNYLGAGFSHAGPWDYVQRVPMFFYGPGFIRELGRVDRAPTLVDIAPTQAALLDFDFSAPDGRVLADVLVPAAERPSPPKLIVTLVWDAAGRNVLDTWPDSWPTLERLIPRGAWFERASIGSSPSNTPPTHAAIGTGAFPRRHGIIDLYQQVGGEIVKPQDDGPGVLRLPTLADLYDVAMDNEPVVGVVATLGAHTGMLGHGSLWEGGDRDIAVTRELEDAETGGAEGVRWELTTGMAPYFRMPGYVNDVPGIEQDLDALDQADGMLDESWRDHPFSQLEGGFQSPARTPYQMRIVEEVIEREGFGADDVPDLLYLNFKAADSIGHRFSLNGIEMSDTLESLDASLGELIRFLDEQVGTGEWALTLTADHGHQYDPRVSGAFQIGTRPLANYLETRFGGTDEAPVVIRVRPTQLWVDEAVLAAKGFTLDDVATAVLAATQAETADEGVEVVDPDARVFSMAVPTLTLEELPCLADGA